MACGEITLIAMNTFNALHRTARRVVFAVLVLASRALAQTPDSAPPPGALKQLSLEQLMDIEVTSVSRRPEKLSETASAIQVITGEEIRRSGASSLPEALRLATNLQVAQVNSSEWAISARGFNNVLANKLLVLIDGRTVYTPLYAGVFWDVQNPPLGDVDRIEIISGPGGTLWGANAINGVINIITKSATETPGWSITSGGGTALHGFGGLRYGGQLSSTVSYRVYANAFGRGSTVLPNGADAKDSWIMGQGGLRLDWNPSANNRLTLQSDFNDGRPDPDGGAAVVALGGNALGRWTHVMSEGSDVQLQLYYDRTSRDFGDGFTEDLATYDIDWQHRFQLDNRQELIWGLGARLMDHQTENLSTIAFQPAHRLLHLYSAFVQDGITLVTDRLRLSIGSKFERNDYTGFEVQPSGRLAWTPAEQHTIWVAASRAVRTPSRLDRDLYFYDSTGAPLIVGDDFQSEELLGYEFGWRLAGARGTFSLSTFYSEYDNLRSLEPGPPPPPNFPYSLRNGVRGHTYGVELSTIYQVSERWRLRGGYTFLRKNLALKPGSNDLNRGNAESNDPTHQFSIQSTADLPGRLELDALVRYVDALPDPHVPSYIGLDVRLGWRLTQRLELSVVGQNLLDDEHQEFGASNSARRIERGVYGKVAIRW